MSATTKQITKAIKLVAPKGASLPIIECVYFTGTHIVATDLELSVKIPYSTEFPFIIDAVQACDGFDAFGVNFIPQREENAVRFVSGKRSIKMASGYAPENFPIVQEQEFERDMFISEMDVAELYRCLDFISNDMLRETLCHVWLSEGMITATDSHVLRWMPSSDGCNKNIALNKKVIQVLNVFGGNWTIESNATRLKISNDEGVEVYYKVLNERMVNYKAVIPQEQPIELQAITKELSEALKQGSKFSNPSTRKVTFDCTSERIRLTFEDLDMEREYTTDLNLATINEDFAIAFNSTFLGTILKHGTDKVSIRMSAPNRAAVVNDCMLLMPLIEKF